MCRLQCCGYSKNKIIKTYNFAEKRNIFISLYKIAFDKRIQNDVILYINATNSSSICRHN